MCLGVGEVGRGEGKEWVVWEKICFFKEEGMKKKTFTNLFFPNL
jgi:hypothetical protein